MFPCTFSLPYRAPCFGLPCTVTNSIGPSATNYICNSFASCVLQPLALSKPTIDDKPWFVLFHICIIPVVVTYFLFCVDIDEFRTADCLSRSWRWRDKQLNKTTYLSQPGITMEIIKTRPRLHLTDITFWWAWWDCYAQRIRTQISHHLAIPDLQDIIVNHLDLVYKR